MKRIALLTTLFAAMAIIASAQSMSDSSSGSGNDNGSMMAPADSMSGTPAMKGSSDSMMAAMDYDTLKKEGKLADTRMGMQLRAAMSSGMKVAYRNIMSAEGLASKNPTVLFFSADWCPYCQEDLKDINANGRQLGKINVVVVDSTRAPTSRRSTELLCKTLSSRLDQWAKRWRSGTAVGCREFTITLNSRCMANFLLVRGG